MCNFLNIVLILQVGGNYFVKENINNDSVLLKTNKIKYKVRIKLIQYCMLKNL